MWDLFSRKVKFQIFGFFTILFLLGYILTGNVLPEVELNFEFATGYSKLLSYFATYLTLVYFTLKFIGMAPWHIKPFRAWLNKNIGPDLRGNWSARISYVNAGGDKSEKELFFDIKMTLFDFSMSMHGDDSYSISNVVASKIVRDDLMGSFVLYYMFESEVAMPLETDVANFQGSAKLRIGVDEVLIGSYWTNRNYQNRKQTAGPIRLEKV